MDPKLVSTLETLCQTLEGETEPGRKFQNFSYRKRKRNDGTAVTVLECTMGVTEVSITLKHREKAIRNTTFLALAYLDEKCLSIVWEYIPHLAHLACMTG